MPHATNGSPEGTGRSRAPGAPHPPRQEALCHAGRLGGAPAPDRVRRARHQLECVAAILGGEAPHTLGWLVEVEDALGRVQDVGAVRDELRRTKLGRAAAECMAEWRERTRDRGAAEWDLLRAGRVAWSRRVARAFD